MAWLEVGICLLAALLIWMLLRLLSNRKPTLSQAATSGFLVYFMITVWLFSAAVLAVPAYLATGALLVSFAFLNGYPPGPFLRENFYYVFVPAYAVTAAIASYCLYADGIRAFIKRLRRS